jgi:hydrogenase maturation protease
MKTLVLGIGNVLYGDEGAGVHVARRLAACGSLPEGVAAVDGGTGSLALLEPMSDAERIVFIDATMDGRPAGTLQRLRPRFASDFPPSLSAHDIGLRELVETWDLLGKHTEMVLYTISIAALSELSMELGPAVAAAVPEAATRILTELGQS